MKKRRLLRLAWRRVAAPVARTESLDRELVDIRKQTLNTSAMVSCAGRDDGASLSFPTFPPTSAAA